MRWLYFIFSHSIFISVCAAALCLQTYLLLHLPYDANLVSLVFFCTLASYNFYWLLSKLSFKQDGISKLLSNNKSYLVLLFFSLLAVVFFLLKSPQSGWQLFVGCLLTLAYSLPLWPFSYTRRLRRLGFVKTLLLAFTWAFVTTMLPLANYPRLEYLPVLTLFLARFFLLLMLCVIFDLRDAQIDKLHNLTSLATELNKTTLRGAMYVVFALYMICGLAVRNYFNDWAQVVAFVVTGIAVFVVFRLSGKKRGYLFYYFVVDGMMLLSFLASLVAHYCHRAS